MATVEEAMKPFRVKEDNDFYVSLSKLAGQKIADIHGYVSDPFGGGKVFVMSSIVFEDGTELFTEGEHDTPYLANYGPAERTTKLLVDIEDLKHEDEDDDEFD